MIERLRSFVVTFEVVGLRQVRIRAGRLCTDGRQARYPGRGNPDVVELKQVDLERAIATFREHEAELKLAGVVRLSIFGSVARGEAGQDSDLDVEVKLGRNFSSDGFDYFWRLAELERQLSGLMGCRVDVDPEPVRRERFQQEIDRDRALAF